MKIVKNGSWASKEHKKTIKVRKDFFLMVYLMKEKTSPLTASEIVGPRNWESENRKIKGPPFSQIQAPIFLYAFHRVIPTIWEPGTGYKKGCMYFSVLKQLILREPDPAQSRVYVLIIITGEREFKSRRKDSLGT